MAEATELRQGEAVILLPRMNTAIPIIVQIEYSGFIYRMHDPDDCDSINNHNSHNLKLTPPSQVYKV